MSKILTEQKVLQKLNIKDFRHLTKEKVILMASMLGKMDPEVAKKALEQFPEFANTTKEMLTEYKEILNRSLESNKESVQSYYSSCNSLIRILEKELENDELTFEQRKYIIEQMLEISKKMGEKDTENKKFIVTLAMCGVVALGVATSMLASVLGGNTKIETNDIDEV